MTVTYASFTLALDISVTNYSCCILNKSSGLFDDFLTVHHSIDLFQIFGVLR